MPFPAAQMLIEKRNFDEVLRSTVWVFYLTAKNSTKTAKIKTKNAKKLKNPR